MTLESFIGYFANIDLGVVLSEEKEWSEEDDNCMTRLLESSRLVDPNKED